jgi:hypothetical protein
LFTLEQTPHTDRRTLNLPDLKILLSTGYSDRLVMVLAFRTDHSPNAMPSVGHSLWSPKWHNAENGVMNQSLPLPGLTWRHK